MKKTKEHFKRFTFNVRFSHTSRTPAPPSYSTVHVQVAGHRQKQDVQDLRFEHASVSVFPQMLPRSDWDHKRGSRGSQVSTVHSSNNNNDIQLLEGHITSSLISVA